jgi:hypothetical protein
MLPTFLQRFEENVNNKDNLFGIKSIALLICLKVLVITFRIGDFKLPWKIWTKDPSAFEISESIIEFKLTLEDENKLLQLVLHPRWKSD